jgi:hypothetical protein
MRDLSFDLPKHGPEALAAAVVLAGGMAFGAPVRFDNDGSFEWRPGACGDTVWLDITLAPADQGGGGYYYYPPDSALSQTYYYGTCNDNKDGNYFYCGYRAFNNAWVQEGGSYSVVDPLAAGTIIGPDSAWGDRTTMSVYRSPCCEANDWGTVGTVAYAGVRIAIDGRTHYGWVKCRLTDPRAAQLEALAWGYESEPDTPVAAGDGGFPGCPADFNGDNQVDFFDYLDFAQAFANEESSADFNGDNQVDFFDYLDFAQAFDEGCD